MSSLSDIIMGLQSQPLGRADHVLTVVVGILLGIFLLTGLSSYGFQGRDFQQVLIGLAMMAVYLIFLSQFGLIAYDALTGRIRMEYAIVIALVPSGVPIYLLLTRRWFARKRDYGFLAANVAILIATSFAWIPCIGMALAAAGLIRI